MATIATGKPTSTWHQQVFALDAEYNSQRCANQSFGMLYIRRRSQLLRDKRSQESDIRATYLKLRAELLKRRYGDQVESPLDSDARKRKTSVRRSTAENFAFAGVHHVFDQHSSAVTMLKFANNDRSRLCCASFDGAISICEATSTPPKVVARLEAHRKGVTAVDWSISNDLIVSSSLDATVRLWDVRESRFSCLRVVDDQLRAEVLCCAFVPVNNNLVILGNSQGLLQLLNVSTGIYPRGGTSKIGGKILSLTCEESGGSLVWAGNDRGFVVSFRLELATGKLTKLQRVLGTGGAVTSLSWRSWLSKESPWPTLLMSCACNVVALYRVADAQSGALALCRKYPVKHRQYLVRSTFCPQMSACLIATGSEDGAVHLIDAVREGKAAWINRLQGHAVPTLALAFNYDESLLASADHQGLIILWRNHQRLQT